MLALLKRLHREEAGQDLIEYALIGALIAVSCIAAMTTLAGKIAAEFAKISAQLT
jgi:pilus assembly protein Flp/PilA